MRAFLITVSILFVASAFALPTMVSPRLVDKTSYQLIGSSNSSSLYRVIGSSYVKPPLFLHVKGSRFQVGYGITTIHTHKNTQKKHTQKKHTHKNDFSPPPIADYASLLHIETSAAFSAFLASVFTEPEGLLLRTFLDYCWSSFLEKRTPAIFLQELQGMKQWHTEHPGVVRITSDEVARSFYTVANMPADPPNIVAMLEEELEPASWPHWLKEAINDVISILEKIVAG